MKNIKKKTKSGEIMSKRITKVSKLTEKIEATQKTAEKVESVNKIISDTIYIRDNIAIDLKNFSLISIPSSKELYSTK